MDSKRIAATRARPLREVNIEPYPSGPGEGRRGAVPMRPGDSGQPAFLITGALNQVFHFKRLAERLADHIPLVGLEAPGKYGDTVPIDTMEGLVDYYVNEIRKVQPHGPYLLGGFSAGAANAYAVAAALEREGDPPHLLMFDYGPGFFDQPAGIAHKLARPIQTVRWHYSNYTGLEGQRRKAYFRNYIVSQTLWSSLGYVGLGWNSWFGRRWRERKQRDRPHYPGQRAVQDALGVAATEWKWEDSLFHQRFTLFRGMTQSLGCVPDERLGFDSTTAPGGVDVRDVPGFHAFMFVEPHIFTLLPEFEDWVDARRGLTVAEFEERRGANTPTLHSLASGA